MSNKKSKNKKHSKVKSTNAYSSSQQKYDPAFNQQNIYVDNTKSKNKINEQNDNMSNIENENVAFNNAEQTSKSQSEKEAHMNESVNGGLNNQENQKFENIDYKNSLEQTQYELEKLKVLYSNSQLECNKLKLLLDNERKQLITKLEEKSKIAQTQVEEKLAHLESSKKEEIIKMKENISTDIVIAFIDPILLFESSIQNSPKDNPAINAYLQGYTMIVNMFKEKLDSLGVEQIDVRVGDAFNEKFMYAFDVEEDPEFEPNKVIRVVGKGFVLGENKKIIKYVSVVVSK